MLNTPKLRFKDKNENAYPEWKTKRAEEIFKNKTIKNMSELPVLSVTQDRGTILREDCGINMKYDKTALNTYKLVNKGDFIISLRSFQGGLEYSDLDGIVSPAYTVLCPLININNVFYKYYLKTYNFICSLNIAVEGIRDGKQISYNSFKTIKLNYPCLEEQEKIAGFLSKVDELINECECEVKDLEEQKKGLMQKIFSQQIRFKDSNNPYPDWKEVQLNTFATLINGRAYKQNELLHTGKYPVLRVGNFFTNGDWYYSNLQLEPDKYAENGDLLYAWSASFGPRIWMGEKVIYHYHIWKISLKKNVDKLFLLYLLEQDVSALKAQMNGGIMMHITKENMENRKFILPCLEEQEKIAKVLSKMDELIEEKKALLSNWQQFKKGLLQQMFV